MDTQERLVSFILLSAPYKLKKKKTLISKQVGRREGQNGPVQNHTLLSSTLNQGKKKPLVQPNHKNIGSNQGSSARREVCSSKTSRSTVLLSKHTQLHLSLDLPRNTFISDFYWHAWLPPNDHLSDHLPSSHTVILTLLCYASKIHLSTSLNTQLFLFPEELHSI